jgi:hypothetical protein
MAACSYNPSLLLLFYLLLFYLLLLLLLPQLPPTPAGAAASPLWLFLSIVGRGNAWQSQPLWSRVVQEGQP